LEQFSFLDIHLKFIHTCQGNRSDSDFGAIEMRCPCGFENLPDAQFCARCGVALLAQPDLAMKTSSLSAPPASSAAPLAPPIKPKSRLGFLIGIAFVVVAVVTYWWFNRPEPDYVPENSGLYVVIINGKVGYIDKNGTLVIQLSYDSAGWAGFSEGLAPVSQQGKWGFIDTHGAMVIQPQFDGAWQFVDGLAAVELGSGSNFKWGFIGKDGKYVINPQFEGTLFFHGGLAPVEVNGEWGFVDKNGTMVIKPHFRSAGMFSEGLAPVNQSGSWGYIDKSGGEVVKPQFEAAESFSEGVGLVLSGGKYGYIDRGGRLVINPQFDAATGFKHGFAVVEIANKTGTIDKLGKFILNPGQVNLVPLGGRTGTNDKSSKWVADPIQRHRFLLGDGVLAARTADGFGYVDKSGAWVVLPTSILEGSAPMRGGIAPVTIAGESCYINSSGMVIWGASKGKSVYTLEKESKARSEQPPTIPSADASPGAAQQTSILPSTIPKPDGFNEFYAKFRTVVRRRDRIALQALMAARFEWALDGYTTRDEALKNIGQIFGWEEFWQSAANAVAKQAELCGRSYCNNRAGYRTWAKARVPLEIMFERDSESQWHWTAVLGD
jgi:hypothetical protein